ncbi:hypothetical protein BD311DRAFT_778459 [Dichomitus squalens]|uniref:Hydrophobic surface binding protein A-domain-containing protein n=1 Tax=Dichomitus squalens TaxID=114155 RepID=A0A4Q9MKX0_9APHY|nr:hypothetical protein BD311DRAFT_778459 [Dichomitus squalens]
MFFSKLSVIAALAFGAFTSARPIDTPVDSVANTVGSFVNSVPVPNVAGGLANRADAPQGLAAILTGLQADLAPATDALTFITAQNATANNIQGPVHEIVDTLTGAVTALKGLVGQDVSVILASTEGTVLVTVDEVAHLVAGVVVLVFKSVGAVVSIAGPAVDTTVQDLVKVVGITVADLLSVVLQLVGTVLTDLLKVLVPLLKEVIPFILNLNLAEVIYILHL